MRKSIVVFTLIATSCGLFQEPEDGKNSLVDMTDEPAGANCSTGGIKISSGLDSNSNGALETDEVTSTKYVCNGPVGVHGSNSLITSVPLNDVALCPNGGVRISSGLDTNNNDVLDESEVQSFKDVCNGLDGLYDKQVVLFMVYNAGGDLATGGPFFVGSQVAQFNAHEFSADSIVYIAYDIVTATNCCVASDIVSTAKWELYDRTNDVYIENSEIISDDIPQGTYAVSKNLKTYFPDESIDLSVAVTNEVGVFANAKAVYLVLYKK